MMDSVEFLFLANKIEQIYKTLLLITDSDKEEYEKHMEKYHINSKSEPPGLTQEFFDNKKLLEQIEELETLNRDLLEDNDSLLEDNNRLRNIVAKTVNYENKLRKLVDEIYMDLI